MPETPSQVANEANMAHPLDFSPDEMALLNLDGVPLADLGIDCSVPKHPHLSVFGAGAVPPDLTMGNLHAYVDRVAAFFLADAVARPLQAVRRGFAEIADVSALRCFTEDELDSLLCGGDAIEQSWDLSVDTLNRYCKLQGYMSSDKTVVALFEVISEFTPVQQRQFVRFLTGCPRFAFFLTFSKSVISRDAGVGFQRHKREPPWCSRPSLVMNLFSFSRGPCTRLMKRMHTRLKRPRTKPLPPQVTAGGLEKHQSEFNHCPRHPVHVWNGG
jgi:hypothetical protein